MSSTAMKAPRMVPSTPTQVRKSTGFSSMLGISCHSFARGQPEIGSFIVPSFFLKPLRDHAFGFTRILGSTERPGTISCSYPRMLVRSPMTAGRQRLEKGIIGITLVASAVKRRVIRSVQQFVVGKALRQV